MLRRFLAAKMVPDYLAPRLLFDPSRTQMVIKGLAVINVVIERCIQRSIRQLQLTQAF